MRGFPVLLACVSAIAVVVSGQSLCTSKQRICENGHCFESVRPCADHQEPFYGGSDAFSAPFSGSSQPFGGSSSQPFGGSSSQPFGPFSQSQSLCTSKQRICENGHCVESVRPCAGQQQRPFGGADALSGPFGGSSGQSFGIPSHNIETPAAVPSTTPLPEGRRVVVKVHFVPEHDAVEFHLCSRSACSGLLVAGYYRNASLAYEARLRENSKGLNGVEFDQTVSGRGLRQFLKGTYVFEAEHREGQLALWFRRHPDKAARVPSPDGPGANMLTVWPLNRGEPMSVEFGGSIVDPSINSLFPASGGEDGSASNSAGSASNPAGSASNAAGSASNPAGSASSAAYLSEEQTCGRAGAGPASLVQNGEKTPIETVPWHAGIYIEGDGVYKNVCGGTLVSPCVVVTAAHCIVKGKMFVALGKYLSGWDSESGKNIHKSKVKNISVSPFFKGHATKMAFDIAVLELENCSPTDGTIGTVCMDKNIQPESSADIKVAGWGNESTPLTELESVTVTQLNFLDCLNVMSNNAGQVAYITSDKFCATRRKGAPQSGLLHGDSGGAALVKRAGSWYMTGVVSSRLKDENNEDVYALTKVSEYVDWIRGFM